MKSIFRFSSGTQKLWITSAVVPTTFTRVRVGMWISFAVTAFVPGYRTSQNHWRPTTSIVICVLFGLGAAVERRTKMSDQTKSVARTTTGTAIPRETTRIVAARSPPPNGS